MSTYLVPVTSKVTTHIVTEASSKAKASKQAEEYWKKNYECKDACFVEGKYVKESMKVDTKNTRKATTPNFLPGKKWLFT